MSQPADAFQDYNARLLLGLPLSSKYIAHYIDSLTELVPTSVPTRALSVAAYPDSVYFNYRHLGLSLLFVPSKGYKPAKGCPAEDLNREKLILDGIDFYNIISNPSPPQSSASSSKPPSSSSSSPSPKKSASSTRSADHGFHSYPVSPIRIFFSENQEDALQVSNDSIGRYFVENLGEPDRKGGGSGPSMGSISIWCEWTKKGIMVEFGGNEARGPGAWDTGKDARWKVISMFPIPK